MRRIISILFFICVGVLFVLQQVVLASITPSISVISGSTTVEVGELVVFDALDTTTDNGSIELGKARYEWDFKDGYTFTSGTWYSLVAVRDATTGNVQVYINNNDTGYTVCSNGWNDAVVTFGGAASAAEDIDIDYMFFYNRELTSDEVAWIYNSGGTRTYADLD